MKVTLPFRRPAGWAHEGGAAVGQAVRTRRFSGKWAGPRKVGEFSLKVSGQKVASTFRDYASSENVARGWGYSRTLFFFRDRGRRRGAGAWSNHPGRLKVYSRRSQGRTRRRGTESTYTRQERSKVRITGKAMGDSAGEERRRVGRTVNWIADNGIMRGVNLKERENWMLM